MLAVRAAITIIIYQRICNRKDGAASSVTTAQLLSARPARNRVPAWLTGPSRTPSGTQIGPVTAHVRHDAALGENEPLQKFLTGTAYATRSTFLATQGATPAQMAFGRDMALPAGFSIGWGEIARRKQKRASESCERERIGEELATLIRKEARY